MSKIICPICNAKNVKLTGNKSSYDLYTCNICTHLFADVREIHKTSHEHDRFRDIITNGMMRNDFDYYSHLQTGEGPGKPTTITATKCINLLNKYIKDKTNKNFLDVGCGSGILMSEAKKYGYNVIGIEPGGWGQIAARKKNLKVIQGFLGDKNVEGNFDIVTATDVVEHVENPVNFLKIISEYTNDDGYILFSIPFADSFEAKIKGLKWNMISPPTHCQFFNKNSLKILIKNCNLKIEALTQFNIRPFLGLEKSEIAMSIINLLIPGPQLICLARKVDNCPPIRGNN